MLTGLGYPYDGSGANNEPKVVANRDARSSVNDMEPFNGSNTYGRWHQDEQWKQDDKVYVVFSYGQHHPMFVYSTLLGTWFENGDDSPSATTSKHHTQLRPTAPTEVKAQVFLGKLLDLGGRGALVKRVVGDKVKVSRDAWSKGTWS